MLVFVTHANYPITPLPGIVHSSPTDVRVPGACAYTYQSHPDSVERGMPISFPHGLSELNGGLQIFKPSKAKRERIYKVLNASTVDDFPFADQSLLSKTFHGEWVPLYTHYEMQLT
jgi:hypothetical protein